MQLGVTARALVAGFVFAVACRELPSSVPLANNGGVLAETGTDRDRQPQAETSAATAQNEVKPPAPQPSKGPPPIAFETPRDAGAADAAAIGADAGAPTLAWAGDYYGSDRLVRHFDGEADDVELDDKAHTRIEQTGPNALLVSVINSASGEVICALRATVQGASASLDSGQSCFGDEGSTATVTDGHLSLAGDRLVLDFAGKVVENDGDDDDDDSLEFRLDYHFDGRRR